MCWHPLPNQGKEFSMDKTIILGIVGSLRKDSYNRLALKAAQELVPEGAVLNLVELHGIPVYDQDTEVALPAAVLEFKRRILAADAILFATPEYNYSVSGVLKNAIDWASRPYGESAWTGKPAALMGASTGSLGAARAQYHLRQILVSLDIPVVNQPEVMIGNAAQRFSQDGRLTDVPTRQHIQKLLAALVELARISPAGKNQAG
jgi:chromate reductase, NAD(P)H dehydrogenase (quinone)